MKIVTDRDTLLKPLQQVSGVVERRQTLPILANILVKAEDGRLKITATDLEVELQTQAVAEIDQEFEFTLPARKLTDICRALPEDATIELAVEPDKAVLRSGKSRFSLGVLPAADYPAIESSVCNQKFTIAQRVLKNLIEKTQFAMAQQDVRYYLNGMLLELKDNQIRTVATDGHRLALSEAECALQLGSAVQVILPRKAVLELGRLLEESDDLVEVEICSNHIQLGIGQSRFISKLIDGKFPDYQRVLPDGTDKTVIAEKELLRQALQRTSILSNEKYRGLRFYLSSGTLQLQANNPEHEEAEEEVAVDYQGENLVIGFNVGYLIEVLGVLDESKVSISLSDANSSCLLQGENNMGSRYVIMPMRL